MSGTPTYRTWANMMTRCRNPKAVNYSDYGGRGIAVCDRWLKFDNFFADMGNRPEGMSLDRIDVNGNYGPDNCRWATEHEQKSNTRIVKIVTLDGELVSTNEAMRRLGYNAASLVERMQTHGVSRQEAIDYYASKRKNPHQHGPKAES